MKKTFKKIFLALVVILFGITNVSAASAPSNVTVGGSKRYDALVAGTFWNYKT